MTVAPSETCPSAAITTESPRRTQITVVERIRRPSPRSRGWARPDGRVETLTATDDLVREEKGGFMGTYQYIVNPLAALSLSPTPTCSWHFLHSEEPET